MQLNEIPLAKAQSLAKRHDCIEFLHKIGGAFAVEFAGVDPNAQPIIITTLLHGNEASGVKALYKLLKEGYKPQHNLIVIVASVVAAITPPVFSHRMLPGQRDLNRCFGDANQSCKPSDLQCLLASSVREFIQAHNPLMVIDIHNTSGNGPAFSVATTHTPEIESIIHAFCHRLIITDIHLGAIMECDFACPVVTIEAGGAQEKQSDVVAYEGIKQLAEGGATIFNMSKRANTLIQTDLLYRPRRLEIRSDIPLQYSEFPAKDGVILHADIEKYNFGITPINTALGSCALDINLDIDDIFNTDRADVKASGYFEIKNGGIVTKQDLRLFMVTTRADIAKSDCLFYFLSTKQ